jgi:hypothetical protein
VSYYGCAARCVDGTGDHDVEPVGYDPALYAEMLACSKGCGLLVAGDTDERRYRRLEAAR